MTKEDLSYWKLAWDVLQTLIIAAVSIYVWLINKHKVNAGKIALLEDNHNAELSTVKNRLTEIETTIKHMPDKRSIDNIHERLNKQNELLNRMEGEMKGVTDNTAMILKALTERGMKE